MSTPQSATLSPVGLVWTGPPGGRRSREFGAEIAASKVCGQARTGARNGEDGWVSTDSMSNARPAIELFHWHSCTLE